MTKVTEEILKNMYNGLTRKDKEVKNVQYIIAFLEGIITFISPCLLPMLPIYVSYFAGGQEHSRKKTLLGAFGFVTGFTTVFVLLGALAGTLGGFLSEYRLFVNIITGAIVIAFGLNFLGVLKFNLFKSAKRSAGSEAKGFFSSVLFGIVFSLGWTPCVGAFLGSALVMASQEGEVIQGVLMLLVYSLGLGIPFVVSAILIDKLRSAFDFIKRHYNIINLISGIFLIAVGILMATGLLSSFLGVIGV